MEPIDIELLEKFSKLSLNNGDSECVYTGAINRRPLLRGKTLEDKLRYSVENIRSFQNTHQSRRKDKADYKLTEYILSVIEDACMCTLDELRNSKRDHGLTVARAIFCRLERRLNKRSHPEIGALINKDHTSSIHLSEKIRHYEGNKIFQVYMRNDKLRHLYESSTKGVWLWDGNHQGERQ